MYLLILGSTIVQTRATSVEVTLECTSCGFPMERHILDYEGIGWEWEAQIFVSDAPTPLAELVMEWQTTASAPRFTAVFYEQTEVGDFCQVVGADLDKYLDQGCTAGFFWLSPEPE